MRLFIFQADRRRFAMTFVLAIAVAAGLIFCRPAYCTAVENGQAPGFTLHDVNSKSHALSSYRGKKVVLFFFCGCKWCHDAARAWSAAERKDFTNTLGVKHYPKTVVVFSGEADEARQFERHTGLDPSTTTMLTDEDMSVTAVLYKAVPCPRAFVLSPTQQILYTNDHKDDAARTIPGAVLIDHVLKAVSSDVQAAASPAVAPTTPAVPPVPSVPPVSLTPVAGNGVTVEGSGLNREAHYDFGTVKQSQVKTIEHVFEFRNDTSDSISIDHIQPSCGCTNAFIDNTTDFPVVVAPGQTINVTAYVDLTDLYPSSVEKSVMIFRTNQINPAGFLDITGTLTK